MLFRSAGATGTLHGGCGLATAADALEKTTGRRLSFLSGQFLARAPVGSEVDIEVTELAVGNRVTQAAVTCRDGEIIVFRAAAALGGHDLNVDRQWPAAPEVPSPDQCDSRGATSESGRSFNDFADIRIAGQKPGERDVYYWARLNGALASSTQGLIALADLLPSGMRVSLNAGFRGSSEVSQLAPRGNGGHHDQARPGRGEDRRTKRITLPDRPVVGGRRSGITEERR